MDQDRELRRAKWLLGAIGIFLISAFLSFDEFRYVLWGRTANGRVIQSREVVMSEGRGRRQPMLSVEYSFNDDAGGSLSERDLVPVGSELPGDGSVAIQHIPGKPGTSRLAGHRNMLSVYIFLASLLLIFGFIFSLYREAKQSTRRPALRIR